MAIIRSNPFTTDLTGFTASEALGAQNFGTPPPLLVGKIDITNSPDGAVCLRTTCSINDPLTVGGIRAELAMTNDPYNTPIAYTWEMLIPSSWPQTGSPYTVMQIHDAPDAGDTPILWPNIEMMVVNDKLLVKAGADFAQKTASKSVDLLTATVVFDQWIKCAVIAEWRKDGAGWYAIYYNGQLVDQRYGIQSAYNDILGPFMKLGVYDCLHSSDFSSLTAYYKNVVVRDASDGFIASIGAPPVSANRRFACTTPTKT